VMIRISNMFWLSATNFFRFLILLIGTFRRFSERWPCCTNWRVFMHQISQTAIISVPGSSSIPNSQNPFRSGELPFHVDVFGRMSIQCIRVTTLSDLHHPFLIVQFRLNGVRFRCSLSVGPEISDKIFMLSIAFVPLPNPNPFDKVLRSPILLINKVKMIQTVFVHLIYKNNDLILIREHGSKWDISLSSLLISPVRGYLRVNAPHSHRAIHRPRLFSSRFRE
jgi:hypothetical protein